MILLMFLSAVSGVVLIDAFLNEAINLWVYPYADSATFEEKEEYLKRFNKKLYDSLAILIFSGSFSLIFCIAGQAVDDAFFVTPVTLISFWFIYVYFAIFDMVDNNNTFFKTKKAEIMFVATKTASLLLGLLLFFSDLFLFH